MKNRIIGVLIVFVLMFTFTIPVRAVTIDELVAQIKVLQKQVADLKVQVKAEVLDAVSDMITPAKLDSSAVVAVPTTKNPTIKVTLSTVPLTVGAQGDSVKTLQNALIEKGLLASDKNTGYFGTLTKQALTTYQTTNNLNVTGKLDTQTVAAINKFSSGNNITPQMANPNPNPTQILFSLVSNTGLPNLTLGDVAFGDYDNDGYLDVLIFGTSVSGQYIANTKLYHNNGNGTFTEANVGLAGMVQGSIAWGDYDNDGYLDILMARLDYPRFIKIYHNELGPNNTRIFTETPSNLSQLPIVVPLKAIWADSNNDGYLDILISGIFNGSSQGSVKLYLNNNGNGNFTEATTIWQGINIKDMAFGDYNNDGRPDLLLGSDTGNDSRTLVYRNNGSNSFTKTADYLNQFGGVAWGDYNNDGYLDILIEGIIDTPDMAKIYKNNGDGTFTLTNIAINGTAGDSSVAWGDYNNDGYIDILISGLSCAGGLCMPITSVYTNKGGDNFVSIDGDIHNNVHTMVGLSPGRAIWGDYNNDGYLDTLLTGNTVSTEPGTYLYRNTLGNKGNNFFLPNTPPSKPTNLNATVSGNNVVLSWDKTTDNQTPQKGLSYNIYLGTTPFGINKISPMAKVPNGFRRITTMGSQNENVSWTVKNLASGIYYWGVQAIDTTFAGSEFATAQNSFTISINPPPIGLLSEQ